MLELDTLKLTVKRKERSKLVHMITAHVWCSLGAIHTECAFVLTKMQRGQWNRKIIQEDGS